ncbi:hypothetical protein N7463_009695 [Penicillium fimorum]|uniref:Nucleoside phosphorylase domain-containing protein n=1 Tax=Penicillium fimorum TaxID=1882269 RepID=A0A9W9XIG7_9EURO|nr:hypothetical protein N7463_009695 [Penicillium fimorum]
MDETRIQPNDLGAALSHLPKRQKTSHHDGLPSPQHEHYTIAWICALYIESAAAQAMLDEIHETLPTGMNDGNTYVLGSIKRHNIVIACLPAEQYGTNNAAIVITNLKRTFPAIRVGLMVGIGGGVPTMSDIRLGDVVVGTRVMQCDLGKMVGDGQLQQTATPRFPLPLLMTAVSSLRSKHELGPSRIPSILQQKMGAHIKYHRPEVPDHLFDATYLHQSSAASCEECDQSKLVLRRKRTNKIEIHYGVIASGNQVIRSSRFRDNAARQYDIKCFEMEAAGLMDVLPCLPIRGICDYSDSHKSKEWQKYAAATAAAFTRELIEELPVTEAPNSGAIYPSNPQQLKSYKHRKPLLDSLAFKQIDARKLTIKTAHTKTCRWLISHPQYEVWLDATRLTQHHGFLWISGKPGAGKSTMMKFAYLDMKSKTRDQHTLTASFFFNARGDQLEKSISGMYRSLLLQLLQGYPDLQTVLDDPDLVSQSQSQSGCPCLNVLKDIFCKAVCSLGQRSFTCFVDALDECDEQQVVDMVQYFEDLAEQTTAKGVLLRICFSSRHYPYIVIDRGIRLTLEDQLGHTRDLEKYIESRLRVKDTAFSDVRSQLLGKAAGVFMWVVLVVDILNKEYRHGGMYMKQRLREIPSDLSGLFKDILQRDNENMEALLLCILWILYAKRPLQVKEFYHSLWSGLSLESLVEDQIPDVTGDDLDMYKRYVISSSKGLAETTMSEQPTVQFIHESVRDFFIKDNGLHEIWPGLGFDSASPSHEKLKLCCRLYMTHHLVDCALLREPVGNFQQKEKLNKEYPFLEYASQHLLYHANSAAKLVPQDEFLSLFPTTKWIKINNLFEKFKIRKYSENANLFYILADKGFPELIRTLRQDDTEIHVFGERYEYPLFAALASGNKDCVAALLNSPSTFYNGIDTTEGLNGRSDLKKDKGQTPLSWAAQNGRAGFAKLLLQTNLNIDEQDQNGQTAVLLAARNGHERVVRLLIKNGAYFTTENETCQPRISHAAEKGHEALMKLLMEMGASIEAIDKEGRTPLFLAAANGREAITRVLLKAGAVIDATDNEGRTPLFLAVANGREAVTRVLLEAGAGIDATDNEGRTPLFLAAANGREAVTRVLLEAGAGIDTIDNEGRTPLFLAGANGRDAVTRVLLKAGATIDAIDNEGRTPLFLAAANGCDAVTGVLLEAGAAIDAVDNEGRTPLFLAAANGREAVTKVLLKARASVDVIDKEGRTPFSMAAREAIAKALLDAGRGRYDTME